MSKGKAIWVEQATLIKLEIMKIIPSEPYTAVIERLLVDLKRLREGEKK